MNKIAVVALLSWSNFCSPLMAQESRQVLFFMDVCRFQDARVEDPTAEIYFSVDGSSVVHARRDDNRFHAAVKINWFLQRIEGEDSVGVAGDSFVLDWPSGEFPEDTAQAHLKKHLFHYHHLQLVPGRYLLQSFVSDLNAPISPASVAYQEFDMQPKRMDEIVFSDIKWVAYQRSEEAVNRSRQSLLPLVTNDAFLNQDSMVFYQEIYNVARVREGKFVIRARILQGDNILYAYETSVARMAGTINAYLFMIPGLEKLRSNTYHLQIELLSIRNEPFATYRKKFYIYNSRLDMDLESISAFQREADLFNEYEEVELTYYLETLAWISTEQEKQFVQVLESYEQKKNYLYSFWEKRRRFPEQKVEALWRGHLMALDYVNQQFKSDLNPGWKTDRGRVFLKYGIPNDVERHPSDNQAVPWELWRYSRLGTQSNVIFVFYDPDLTLEEYPLLHSSKYGELYNPRWQEQVMNRNSVNTPGSIDFEQSPSGQRVNDKFDPND